MSQGGCGAGSIGNYLTTTVPPASERPNVGWVSEALPIGTVVMGSASLTHATDDGLLFFQKEVLSSCSQLTGQA
jgi:hypothetical protein